LFQRKETRKKAFELLKFAFAHHPMCESFKDHLYNVRGVWICRGCAVAYPVTILTLLSSFVTQISLKVSFTIAVIALLITIIISISFYHEKLAFMKRLFFGMFIGAIIYFLLLYKDLSVLICGLIFLNAILTLFSLIRYVHMKKICDSCVYSGDWNKCVGFLEIRKTLFKNTLWEIE